MRYRPIEEYQTMKNNHIYKIAFGTKRIYIYRCLYENNELWSIREYPKTAKNVLRIMMLENMHYSISDFCSAVC